MSSSKNTLLKSPLTPLLPNTVNAPGAWAGLHGSGRGLAVLEAAKAAPSTVLVVARHAQALRELEEELRFYAPGNDVAVRVFPDWESLPYDIFSPHPDIVSERLASLYELPRLGRGVVLTAASTLLHRLAPCQYVAARSFQLQTGERLDLGAFRAQLAQASYQSVSQVMEPGEFSVRGGLIDLFPVGTAKPLRLDLFDDRIESIRSFDPATQRSAEPLKEVRLLPAREFPQTQEAIQHFRQRFRARFEGDPQRYAVYREVSEGLAPPGIEYYLPLFFEHTATLFDYLPPESLVILDDGVETAARQFLAETGERYRELVHDRSRALLAPPELFLELDELDSRLIAHVRIQLLDFSPAGETAGHVAFDCPPPPSLPVAHRAATPYHALFDFLRAYPGRVLVVAETLGRRETLRALLADHGAPPVDVRHWQEFLRGTMPLAITVGTLEKGLWLKQPAITVITEPMLYGERAAQRRRRERAARDPAAVLTNLTQLQPGDAVVHEDHGVGRYLGLITLDVGDGPGEFVALEYAGGDRLYLPVLSLHLISRYTGTDPANAPLHKLGGEAWEKARKRALEKAYDAAAEILEIHALRAARRGQAVPLRDEAYQTFADRFPFEETPDQARAINEVLSDMEAAKSMDRLVCGDVGFGKTEVAIRAAFLALHGGAQVALLVPTTLLAQQHYETFHERFMGLPYRIELLSRFRSKADEKQVLAGLAAGTVHLVIGTHRLLQDDVHFKNLGLLILDEEHRFGVRQKEQLKKLRSEVDILTLTATPIPRTLNMALAGMRDISLIGEPPPGRLSVKTFVGEWNRGLIREACLREIRRGGQVYYLHNEVRTIERTARELAEHLPEAQIRIAHGQMAERELEHIMLDFYHQRFNVLVCSTIIESGIDVPTANTIIIERADKLGLSQLHQLRGRVGRSHHRAYAYLLIPGWGAISADARKRLEAIASLEDLGAGFALASHDLEIRGAGELLGEAQSGAIDEVGFTLYAELLQRAVETLKRGGAVGNELAAPKGTEVNLHAPTLLPEDYLPDVHLRLMLYKRIAAAQTLEVLEGLREEVIDRFGLLPEAAQRLFKATALKLRATPLGIRKIEAGPKGARIEFRDRPDIDPGVILRLLQSQPRLYRLDGPTRLRLTAELPDAEARLKALNALLDALAVGLVEPPARVQGKA
jgi:transcription-repair coupling factor (superfamily II helicase)